MMPKKRSPYGSWSSPLSAESLAKDVVGITAPRVASGLQAAGHPAFFYIETNCDGRGTIKSIGNGQTASITPESTDVGNTINGYGGGSFVVSASGTLVFTDTSGAIGQVRPDSDGRFGAPEVLTKHPGVSYGDITFHPSSSLVLAVREQRHAGQKYPETSIVCIDTNTASVAPLRSGADFYSHPRFSPDGRLVSWLEWDHPHMPWTGARLYVAALGHEGLAPGVDAAAVRRVGGHTGVGQPRWGLDDNTLFYACDETGYQQLYCASVGLDAGPSAVSCSDPQWLRIKGLEDTELAGAEFWLGSKTYLELRQGVLLVTYTRDAASHLALVDRVGGTCVDIDIALNDIAYDAIERVSDNEFLVVGAAVDRPTALYLVSVPEDTTAWRKSQGATSNTSRLPCRVTELAQTFDLSKLPVGTLSTPQAITFPRRAASQGGDATSGDNKPSRAAPEPALGHAFLMLPTSADSAPAGGGTAAYPPPPCLVVAHGGPTKHHRPSVNLEAGQYWTSRGYAVVLLNHVGSTGYGRGYRDALDGRWGEADVADAADCARSLAAAGVVDGARVGVTGVSAGGYLTLQAACTTAAGVWAGGVSVCGIGDMRGFAATSHKFERCYDWLLIRGRGALGGDEGEESGRDRGQDDGGGAAIARPLEELYDARSPIKHVQGLKTPLLLLQGRDDEVVTSDQATTFADAFRQQHLASSGGDGGGAQVALVMYDGEGHGFHLAKTKEDALRRQEEWWSRTLLSRTTCTSR